jgi:DNA-directed RNA polymerase subunit H
LVKHELAPEHELLGPEETQRILDNYKITREQLPKILLTDPAIKHLEPKVGDVIKILRESKFIGKSVYYRVVTE